MKHFLSFLLGCFLLASAPTRAQGFLKVRGTEVVDGSGKPVILRGMGLGGWMLQEGYMLRLGHLGTQQRIRAAVEDLVGPQRAQAWHTAWLNNYTRRRDIEYMVQWGFNSVRLPIHYNLYTLPSEREPVAGQHTWLEEGFRRTDSLLAWCKASGLYLILDLHAAPGGQGADLPIADRNPELPSLWDSEANMAKTVALWRKLAERYKDEPYIGAYDLLNEPNWGFADTTDKNGLREPRNEPLRRLYIRITDTIRAVDKNHILIIEGNGWGNNYNGMFPLWDRNTVISFHKYWNFNRTEDIQRYLDIRKEQNAPIWLGETGENSNTWFREAVRLVESHGIGWAWWPLKKLGHNNPLEVVPPEGYRQLLEYWNGRGPKPAAEAAFAALMQLTEAVKAENCIVHRDVIDALFRQVRDSSAIPYRYYKSGKAMTVEAAHYDLGPAGVAYSDRDTANYWVSTGTRTAGNRGNTYRNDGVDLAPDSASGRPYVDNVEVGEWLQYTLEMKEGGTYRLGLTAAGKGAALLLSVDGGKPQELRFSNGGWQTVTLPPVRLTKGVHRLRVTGAAGAPDLLEVSITSGK